MRILVTGGAGFIGSHVVDAYIEAGHEVWVLDDLSRGRRHNVNSGATFTRMDLRSPDLHDFIKAHEFDCINHHAAQIDVRASVADPVRDAMVNVVGSLNLLEAARHHGPVPIIFASTGGAIYGTQHCFPAIEDHPTGPLSPYGVAKCCIEHYLQYYRRVHGLPYLVLRYANVYGPRQDPEGEAGVVAIFCGRVLRSQRLVIYGDGEQTRDYVYVKDVAYANLLALNYILPGGSRQQAAGSPQRAAGNWQQTAGRVPAAQNGSLPGAPCQLPASKQAAPCPLPAVGVQTGSLPAARCPLPASSLNGHVFNIGTGVETSVNALVALLLQSTGRDCPITYHPARTGEQLRSCIDPARAEQRLGWTPLTPLVEGLSETFAWFRRQEESRSRALAGVGQSAGSGQPAAGSRQ